MGKAIKPGDIIAFSGKDYVSDLINICSLGIPRVSVHHVGLTAELHGDILLYESKGLDAPCCRSGKPVEGVQAHLLSEVIEQTKDSAIWHYPLRRELYRHEIDRLHYFLDSKVGISYDMPGAIWSGGILVNLLGRYFRPEDTSSLFCSELAMAAMVEVGIFATNDISGWSPNRLCRTLVKNGILDRPVRMK